MTQWFDLKADTKFENDQLVMLYYPNHDERLPIHDTDFPGLCISTSNPKYATINAFKHGYTMFAYVTLPSIK